jgi:S1-C subfamily serine protease
MRRLIVSLCALVAVTALAAAQTEQDAPVVRVTVTYQEYDPFLPWQKRSPQVRTGFGTVIDGAHVLTTESLVRNHTLIEIQLARAGENITTTLVKADPQVDLALLHVTDVSALAELEQVSPAEDAPSDSQVEIIQIDETSGIQRGDGQIVKALVDALPSGPYSALQYDVLTDLNVDGAGAPVLHDGHLAGIILSYSRASRTGKMLPAVYIARFINDARDGDYDSAGFSWKPLVDPTKRAYLGVGDESGGVQVLSCLPGSGAGKVLKSNDVILAWDGHTIDRLGYYTDDAYGRLQFPHLIKGRRTPGESVIVTIVRDGSPQDVTVPLTRRDEDGDLIPENVTGAPGAYLIEGGLVIRELTGNMLQAYGGQWQTRVDPRLAHLYLTRQYAPEQPGDRVLLLSAVLPDPINIGYQHFRDQIIEKVNGEPVRNVRDVFRIVNAEGTIRTLSLRAMHIDIVLDQNELPAANQRIARQYRLPALRRTP